MQDLILASASPRRRQLLAYLGHPFRVIPADVDETAPLHLCPRAIVELVAGRKAIAVADRHLGALVLAADTLVAVDGEVIGKPANAAEALETLTRLRGRRHSVLTGVCVRHGNVAMRRVVSTDIQMRDFADHEIRASIARGTPFDKAGSYAIQDSEFSPVASYAGCYCNVVGLPLWDIRDLLQSVAPDRDIAEPDHACARCAVCPRRGVGDDRPE